MDLSHTVADVATLVQGRVHGAATRKLRALRALDQAGPEDLAAVFRAEAAGAARSSAAGCLLVPEACPLEATPACSLIEVADPEAAMDQVASTWGPREHGPAPGIHPTALVDESATVDASAAVGPWVCVGPRAVVGARTRLWPGVYVGADARVGCDGRLYPHAVVGDRCIVGERVVLHSGAVLGSDGFGFRRDAEGRHVKSPQVGIVVLGDDVEVGANSTVDRARLEATVLADGVKIDGQVHVGHNCSVGEHSALAAQVGLAGRAVLGRGVLVGGQAGVADGVHLADGTVLGAASAALKDTPAAGLYLGFPCTPHRQWKRQVLNLARLPDLIADVRMLKEGQGRGA